MYKTFSDTLRINAKRCFKKNEMCVLKVRI